MAELSTRSEISAPMKKLSAYVADALTRPLSDAVADRARIHLVDTFAAMVSGSRLLPGQRGARYVRSLRQPPQVGLVGTALLASPSHAALANGMSAHADETDDTHPPTRSHPGSSVVPAALAICERDGLSGKELLRATVLGYDVCARVLLAFAPKAVSSTYGHLFGAAAAAAALLKLDAHHIRHVFTYAGQQVSGLYTRLRDPLHVEKAFAVGGLPARNGVDCALMVEAGFSGVDDVFSGEHNLLATYSPEGDVRVLARDLGRDFEIMRGGIKCWSAGGPIQGPLHVLNDMMQEHGLEARQVAKLVAHLPDRELVLVTNRKSSDISLQHLLALMLVDGGLTFASSHDATRMKDPRVLAMRRRVEAVGDPKLTDTLRRWRCRMEITLQDGRTLTHQTLAAKGTSENPVTRSDEEAKARDLMEPVLGRARTRQLIDTLFDIERVNDVQALRRLYSKGR